MGDQEDEPPMMPPPYSRGEPMAPPVLDQDTPPPWASPPPYGGEGPLTPGPAGRLCPRQGALQMPARESREPDRRDKDGTVQPGASMMFDIPGRRIWAFKTT